jgi:hypothetical protein
MADGNAASISQLSMGSNAQHRRFFVSGWLPVVLALALPGGLAGCSSGREMLIPLGSTAADQPAFVSVHDLPPPRATTPMSEEDRKKVEAELIEARNQQQEALRKPPPKRQALQHPDRKVSHNPQTKQSAAATGNAVPVKE